MPEESMLQALDTRRIVYAQQKKAAENLLTALKGITSALTKATRLVQDYATTTAHVSLEADTLAGVYATLTTLTLKDETIDLVLPTIRHRVKELTRTEKALKECITALNSTLVDVVRLDQGLTTLRDVAQNDALIGELIAPLEEELQHAQQRLTVTFGESLRDALVAHGITIGGRPPRFEIGRFEVTTDFITRCATLYYGKDVVTARVPL